MKRYGLIGRPLGHSFSAGYFAAKFRREGITGCDYALYELPSIEALPELLGAQPELQGFNVTIPYKQRIFDYLDDVSEEATRIGAVNCVRRDGGRLTGFNTDRASAFRCAFCSATIFPKRRWCWAPAELRRRCSMRSRRRESPMRSFRAIRHGGTSFTTI